MNKQILGQLGEKLALQYLNNKGYQFIKANFRSRFGEIDLIFQDKLTLVFVEVKTRFDDSFGPPETAVTPYKIRSIIKTGQYFKLRYPNYPDSLRIDVVAIIYDVDMNRLQSLRHIKNITM